MISFSRLPLQRNRTCSTKMTRWEAIHDLNSGNVKRTVLDDSLPDGPVACMITYEMSL